MTLLSLVLLGAGSAWAHAQALDVKFVDVPPIPRIQLGPKYPKKAQKKKLAGAAYIEFIANKQGRVERCHVVAQTDPMFGEEAVRAVSTWRFNPGLKAGQPVNVLLVVPVLFTLSDHAQDPETMHDLQAQLTGFPAKASDDVPTEFRYDTAPRQFRFETPVIPWVGRKPVRKGKADISYTVDIDGRVSEVNVIAATNKAVGLAAQAAVERWQFTPATRNGEPISALGRCDIDFNRFLAEGSSEALLLKAVERGDRVFANSNELDAKLSALFQVAPEYPLALAQKGYPAGSARITCIVDKEGYVCLPRIVEATQDEFGWAAATALTHWRFAVPMVKGEPVNALVEIPFEFKGAEF